MTHDNIEDQGGPHSGPPEDAQSDEVDEASEESFPSSDPPATWAGSDDV